MKKPLIIAGAIMALLAVFMGAFGAHALRPSLSTEMLAVYQTAVQYQMTHALALLMMGAIAHFWQSRWLKIAGSLLFVGILLFSGSLYVLSLAEIKTVVLMTPIGGVALLLGWLALIKAAWEG